MRVRYLLLLLWLLALPACADETTLEAPVRAMMREYCPHWGAGVVAPEYMEAWVETLEVKDDRGRWVKIPQGMAAELGQTVGWASGSWQGDNTTIDSSGAPMEIFIRWQSLAEAQTYTWQFIVPQSMRDALAKKESVLWQGQTVTECRSTIAIGVAPGGHTVVWIRGGALKRMEILRGQADVEPRGPGQGWGKGYAYPLTDKAKQYIQDHGIPYGSW